MGRKGILLAGGHATRMLPMTSVLSKQELHLYDKPMIYYPLATLMFSDIRDILVISTPKHIKGFKELLEDGSWLGINISYKEQPKPEGIAQAFILGEQFLDGSNSFLMLGDNIVYGHGLPDMLRDASNKERGATIFGYHVKDPERYGVVEFNGDGKVLSIEEKPSKPKSDYAVTGIYFYDDRVVDIAKRLKPSARGELEITDANKAYLELGELEVKLMGRGFAWLDTGTPQAMADATAYIRAVEERQGLKINCPEEVAWENGWIDNSGLGNIARVRYKNSDYGQYLLSLLEEKYNK